MKQAPEEFKSPAKTSRQDRDPRSEFSKADHVEQDQHCLDDPLADARRHDSTATPPAPVPPLDSLDENSDLKGFMSPNIGEDLRRSALRKFFHLPKFNRRDGLDDYDEDFKSFQNLGDILTSDMRYHLERLAKQKTSSRLPATLQSEAIEQHVGTPDSKSGNISHRIITEPMPVMEKNGALFLQPAFCAHGNRGLTGCTRCLDVCPAQYRAIDLRPTPTGPFLPYVEESLCTGCGVCEYECPLDGEAAIRVVAANQIPLLPKV